MRCCFVFHRALAAAVFGALAAAAPARPVPFVDGIALIDFASVPPADRWAPSQEIPGHLAPLAYRWNGPDLFGQPGRGVLTYRVAFPAAGAYGLLVRSRIGKGRDGSEHNDSWVRVRYAEGVQFYAVKSYDPARPGSRVVPGDTVEGPRPRGTTRDGWFKFYQNDLSDWTWVSVTGDHDGHHLVVEVDGPREVEVEFSGRSRGHVLDRFVLFDLSQHRFDPFRADHRRRLDALHPTEVVAAP
jgi:hypothetical protein